MTRIIMPLVFLIFVLEAMAGKYHPPSILISHRMAPPAPLTRRAVASDPACFKLLDQAQTNSVAAATTLGDINPITDVGGTDFILQAQLALQRANSIVGPIVLSLDLASLAPPANTSSTGVLAALQDAQKRCRLMGRNAKTTANLQQAGQNLTQALDLAQKAVDLNCTALADTASAVATPSATRGCVRLAFAAKEELLLLPHRGAMTSRAGGPDTWIV
ncbi:hypothetical protein B0H14DRAFT_2575438 [Mycena olivaceomarginata]|nr:hypothetical protein B0H14DRAFT_2575438 [Mycena olivaceomarginata]